MVLDVTLSEFPFVCAMFVMVKVSLSGSVSLSSITPFDAFETVVLEPSVALAVSFDAFGASLPGVTFTVIVLAEEL